MRRRRRGAKGAAQAHVLLRKARHEILSGSLRWAKATPRNAIRRGARGAVGEARTASRPLRAMRSRPAEGSGGWRLALSSGERLYKDGESTPVRGECGAGGRAAAAVTGASASAPAAPAVALSPAASQGLAPARDATAATASSVPAPAAIRSGERGSGERGVLPAPSALPSSLPSSLPAPRSATSAAESPPSAVRRRQSLHRVHRPRLPPPFPARRRRR